MSVELQMFFALSVEQSSASWAVASVCEKWEIVGLNGGEGPRVVASNGDEWWLRAATNRAEWRVATSSGSTPRVMTRQVPWPWICNDCEWRRMGAHGSDVGSDWRRLVVVRGH